MAWFVALVLIFPWVLGLLTSHTMGGFLHLLPAMAMVVLIWRVLQVRRATANDRPHAVRGNRRLRGGAPGRR